MASSLEEIINRTATNLNKGIKEKVEDGSFNRLGEGLGEGVNGIAAGMISFLDMAKGALGQLKDKTNAVVNKSKKTTESPEDPETQENLVTPENPEPPEIPEASVPQDATTKFCSKCGQENPIDAAFCCECGSPL